jgi:hypothetical protein
MTAPLAQAWLTLAACLAVIVSGVALPVWMWTS